MNGKEELEFPLPKNFWEVSRSKVILTYQELHELNANAYKEGHQEGFNVGLAEAKIRFHQSIDPCIMGDNSKHFIGKVYKAIFDKEYVKPTKD